MILLGKANKTYELDDSTQAEWSRFSQSRKNMKCQYAIGINCLDIFCQGFKLGHNLP
jgi:hypothetical protein